MAPAITFMVPYGLSQAATIRVGLAVGRGSRLGVYHAGWTALAMGAGFMAAMAVLMMLFPEPIVRLSLLDISSGERAAVAAIAVEFIFVAALFQVVDGMQAIGAGALRGMKDTAMPMLGAAVSYWAIGFAGSLLFGFRLGWGGVGIWVGLALGLAAAAVFMTGRFALRGPLRLFERGSRGLA
jgi:MATE family multidrug resistance protein